MRVCKMYAVEFAWLDYDHYSVLIPFDIGSHGTGYCGWSKITFFWLRWPNPTRSFIINVAADVQSNLFRWWSSQKLIQKLRKKMWRPADKKSLCSPNKLPEGKAGKCWLRQWKKKKSTSLRHSARGNAVFSVYCQQCVLSPAGDCKLCTG